MEGSWQGVNFYLLSIIDIPKYFKGSPEGFAVFMTIHEKRRLQQYLKSNQNLNTNIALEQETTQVNKYICKFSLNLKLNFIF
jgi:hypothetical protein